MSMDSAVMKLLAGARRIAIEGGMELRLLSAFEVLEARREAEELARENREKALCANACLLSRALEREKKPVFDSGRAVLEGLTALQIEGLARRWAAFNRRENPAPEDGQERGEALKKAWSTRLTHAFGGVCSDSSKRCPPRPE